MGAGRGIRWILILLAAVAIALAGDDEAPEEKQEAPEKWEDDLLSYEPLRFESGSDEQQVELTIERWGEAEGPQKFTVSVVSKPAFVEEATWLPGAEIEFGEKDDTKTVHLRLKLAGTGSGQDELVLAVRAEDEEITPRERRITLAFVFGRAKTEGAAYVIKHDAPEKIEPDKLPDHVDWDAKPVYCCDRVALFFTPPVDLKADKVVFHWNVHLKLDEEEGEDPEKDPGKEPDKKKKEERDQQDGKDKKESDDEKARAGSFGGCWNPGDWFHHDGMARFEQGKAPAAFGIELVPFGRPRQARFYPGRYVITSAGERESDNTLFGEKGAVVLKPVEVAPFELADLPDLRFAGFEVDAGKRHDLSGLESVADGVAEFGPASAGGRKVRFEGRADFLRAGDAGRDRDGKEKRTTFKRVIEIHFPEVLKLSESEMGKLECKFDRGKDVHGPISMGLDFIGTIFRLVPVAEGKLDETLVLDEDPPQTLGWVTKDRNEEDGYASSPFMGLSIKALPELIHGQGLRPYTVSFARFDTYGRPDRPLGPHLRDSATRFVLPVRFSFMTGTHDPQAYDQFGYAIYKVDKR